MGFKPFRYVWPVVLVIVFSLCACSAKTDKAVPTNSGQPETVAVEPAARPAQVQAPPEIMALVPALQGLATPGAKFSAGALNTLKKERLDPDGFVLTGHRAIRRANRSDKKPGHSSNGLIQLHDENGRRAVFGYTVISGPGESGQIKVDLAAVARVHPKNPGLRVFLVPKNNTPGPGAAWKQTYEAARAANAMPPDGITDADILKTHDLILFALDRTESRADLVLRMDMITPKDRPLTVRLTAKDYLDYDGWRVAIISIPD